MQAVKLVMQAEKQRQMPRAFAVCSSFLVLDNVPVL